MGSIDDRRLVVCETCGKVYSGYRDETGTVRALSTQACRGCGGESFVEWTLS